MRTIIAFILIFFAIFSEARAQDADNFLFIVVVPHNSPYKSFSDIASAKKKEVSCATSHGLWTGLEACEKIFKSIGRNGASGMAIPYKSDSAAISDLGGGLGIDFAVLPISAALQYIKASKVVGLAVSSSKRHSAAPDIPTLVELGYK